jgi:hypothetical protein
MKETATSSSSNITAELALARCSSLSECTRLHKRGSARFGSASLTFCSTHDIINASWFDLQQVSTHAVENSKFRVRIDSLNQKRGFDQVSNRKERMELHPLTLIFQHQELEFM